MIIDTKSNIHLHIIEFLISTLIYRSNFELYCSKNHIMKMEIVIYYQLDLSNCITYEPTIKIDKLSLKNVYNVIS